MSTVNHTTVQASSEQPIPHPTNIDTLYFKYLLWFAISMYGVLHLLIIFNQLTGYVPTPQAQNMLADIIYVTAALIAREMSTVVWWIARNLWRVFKRDVVGGIKESLTRIETEYIYVEVPVKQVIIRPRKIVRNATRKGFVYILAVINTPGLYKIGRTYNLNDRLHTFEVKLPFEVRYEYTIATDDMPALESNLHRKFAKQRNGGEFFNLSAEDIQWIKDTYNEDNVVAGDK